MRITGLARTHREMHTQTHRAIDYMYVLRMNHNNKKEKKKKKKRKKKGKDQKYADLKRRVLRAVLKVGADSEWKAASSSSVFSL